MRQTRECDHCGADVPASRLACRECGSDARTGWLDDEEVERLAVDLPAGGAEADEEYERTVASISDASISDASISDASISDGRGASGPSAWTPRQRRNRLIGILIVAALTIPLLAALKGL